MKKLLIIPLLVVILLTLTSCGSIHILGKNSANIQKQADKIQTIEDKQSNLNTVKIDDMTVLAMGTDYALNKETNASTTVNVAKEINKRVISEGGYSPTITEIKNMQQMIDDLVVSNKIGVAALKAKDIEIQGIQSEEKMLVNQKDTQIKNFQTLAQKTAGKADDTQNTLNKYTAYWGLGAIALGIKSLALHLIWATLIFVVIFIILRALSLTNPLAAAIFGIFQSIGASVIHLIEAIIPSSINTLNEAISDVKVVSNVVNNAVTPITTIPSPITIPQVANNVSGSTTK